MNVRGAIRLESGITKKYVVKVEKSPLEAVVSMNAMQQTLGLSTVSDDVVLPAPTDRGVYEAMVGMALKRDAGGPLAAFRVLLLVQGTKVSHTESLDDTLPVGEQTFKMVSNNAGCLLSDSSIALKLMAYSDFKKTMTDRLDKEVAVVRASAVERIDGSGSASLNATVDQIEKLKG